MGVRWIQNGEPPLAGVYNRPLRDFVEESGWLNKSTQNTIGVSTDIRTLPSGSYNITSGHPQNPTNSSATLLIQMSSDGNATFMVQKSGEYSVHVANTKNASSGTIVWAEVYHSRNQLNVGTTAASARSALELGNAATLNIGTGANTIAAGNDSRIVNAASVTYVNTGLNAKTNQSTRIIVGPGMTGGGTLSGDRTIGMIGAPRKYLRVVDFNELPELFPYCGQTPILTDLGSTNGPIHNSSHYFYVEQMHYNNNGIPRDKINCTQIAYPYGIGDQSGIGEGIWTRSRYAGVWSQWVSPATPIGSTYIQFPGYKAPNDLFGGTWKLIFNTEGAFFRTEGGNASGFGGGIQGDMIGSHNHYTPTILRTVFDYTGGPLGYGQDTPYGLGPHVYTSHTGGPETRPRNRTVRIWVRNG